MKLIREYINEKFDQDSDPIHDMGIGNKFGRVKPRDVIKARGNEELNFENNIYYIIDSPDTPDTQPYNENWGGVVYNVERKDDYILMLTVAGFGSYRSALSARERSNWKGFVTYKMSGTYEQWNKYYVLLEY